MRARGAVRARSRAAVRAATILATAFLAAVLLVTAGCGKKNIDKVPKDRDAGLTPAQLYEKGVALSRKGHYFRARQTLEKILSRGSVGPEILGNANLAIADAYFYDGGVINVAEALSRYTSFLTFYPSHRRADYAQYQLALCYWKQSLGPDKDQATTRQALDNFRKVETAYPASDYAAAARDRENECRERLANADLRVGRFYMKRKAWDGAASRFRTILEEYPRYSDRDEVTFLLAQALRAGKKWDEAQLYFQKVLNEFPKSRFAAQAREALASPEDPSGKTAEAPKGKKSEARRGAEAPDRRGGR